MASKDPEHDGVDPRRHSRVVVDGLAQAPSRAMLRAVGFTDADFAKPQVGIASTWSMVTPCNMHIDGLARQAAEGADSAGAKGVLFNTITVSDGISMGTPGMRYSLVSREVIADSIETVAGAEGFDGLVTIGGCDKNMPGCAMAMARLDRPSIFVYGGTIQPGPKHRDIISVFEAVGSYAAGEDRRRRAQGSRIDRDSGARVVCGHVHGQYDGIGHRSPRPESPEQLRAGGRVRREVERLPARGRGRRGADRARHQTVRHLDAKRLSRMRSRP